MSASSERSTAKLFMHSRSQAVRLPKEFRFDVEEVEVSREGDAVILRPKSDTSRRWASLHAAVRRDLEHGAALLPDDARP